MTLAEFRLRAFAYRRKEQFEWAKFRRVAYNSLIAFNVGPKSIPKTERAFMALPLVDDVNKKQATAGQIEKFEQAMRDYNAKKNMNK